MKRSTFNRAAAALLITGALLSSQSAFALGTASGTPITNSATLNYSTGGVPQPAASSTPISFVVDNLVRVVVAEVGSAHTPVAPGALAQVTTFTVTNTGNTTQDYSLVPTNQPNGATVTLGATLYTDSWDGSSCIARVESGTTAGYQPGEDTAAAILSLGADLSRTVHIVCDVPGGLANNVDAVVTLTATTSNAGTCTAAGASCVATVQTVGADTAGSVDVVFGDAAGSDDAARDGTHSARDAYRVSAAVITVNKSAQPICDPFNNSVSNPKNIPGAYVRYTITIANGAGASASAILTTVSDALNAATAIDPDLRTGTTLPCTTSAPENVAGNGFRATCPAARASCAANIFYTTAAADDAIGISGSTVTATFGDGPAGTKLLPTEAGYVAGELKPGESVTIRFNVVIQ